VRTWECFRRLDRAYCRARAVLVSTTLPYPEASRSHSP
jgi:hypothetical protein